jgi:hypothetical protein
VSPSVTFVASDGIQNIGIDRISSNRIVGDHSS